MVSIGIDLGTTYSVMAYIDKNGQPQIIPNQDGNTLTPSVISFYDNIQNVGTAAKAEQRNGSTNIAAFFKRLMGEEYYSFEYNDQAYDTIELSSLVLKKLKADAQEYLGQPVSEAVITVPAYFNNIQREATIEAGKRAGLRVLGILNEPTAAAIAYGFKERKEARNILVYDLGGGTFDVTIARVDDTSIQVLSTDGDYNLGGKDFDDRIVLHACEQFERDFGLDPLEDIGMVNEILSTAEQVKIRLTNLQKTTLPILYQSQKGAYEFTQELFEELTKDLLERTWTLAEMAVQSANLSWQEIDDVILVGGSTRMTMVPRFIEEQIGKKPHYRINVDEVVAIGAAIQANQKSEQYNAVKPRYLLGAVKKVDDVMSHSLGMVAINEDYTKYINSIIIHKNKRIPTIEKKSYKIVTSQNRKNNLEIYGTQGESKYPQDCIILGKYSVTGISHSDVQPVMIEVTYTYDENGIVQVAANEKNTKKSLVVQVEKNIGNLDWLTDAPKKVEEVHQELTIMLVIDTSYSMKGEAINEAMKAAQKFVDEMNLEHTSIGLLAFATKEMLLQMPTKDEKVIRGKILSLPQYVMEGTAGFTTSAEPLRIANAVLNEMQGPRFAIVLTDGLWENGKAAIDTAQQCKRDGIEIIAVGFGSANREFLNLIATSDTNALFTNVNQLVSSFTKIAQVVSEKSLSYRGKGYHPN